MLTLMVGSVMCCVSSPPTEVIHVSRLPGFALTLQLNTTRSPTDGQYCSCGQLMSGASSSTHTYTDTAQHYYSRHITEHDRTGEEVEERLRETKNNALALATEDEGRQY